MTDKKRIFISHATKDDPLIHQIVDVLHKAGFDTFVDHDGGLTPRTANWDRDLRRAIVDCHVGILVMTEKSLASNICGAECLLVQELKKPLYIIRAEVCKPESVWLYIKMIQHANIVDQFDMGMNALIRALNGDVDRNSPTAYMPQITGMSEMTQYLPYLKNPLRGRLDDANELLHLLQNGGIVQLIGFGGLGKSRISAEIARAYPNGALWHRCSSVTRREDIFASLRVHLGLEMDAPIDLILDKIATRKSLIVIDNAEDVVPDNREGYIGLCNQLANHGVPILLTSREKWDNLHAKSYQLKSFTEHDIEIVTQMTQDFYAQFGKKFTDDEARQLAKSGRFHPKLIEFAVGQIGGADYSHATIVRRLDELTHDSIQKALYEMITKTLQQMRDVAKRGDKAYDLIHNLTWLQATFPKEAIIALKPPSIVTDDDLEDAIVTLKRYQFIRNAERDGRYQLAELLREAIGTNQDVFNTYADFYILRAKAIFYDLYDSPELWGDGIGGVNEDDVVNITSLGRDLVYLTQNGTTGDLERALEFVRVTRRYVQLRMEAQAWNWLKMGLSAVSELLCDKGDDEKLISKKALILNDLGVIQNSLGYPYEALGYYGESLVLRRQQGNQREEATTLSNIGEVYRGLGDMNKALVYFNQALLISRTLGYRHGEANILTNIGGIYHMLGNIQKALEYFEQVLPIDRAIGDKNGEATTLTNIGGIYHMLGNIQKALEYFEQALPIYLAVGNRGGESVLCFNMGMAYKDLGNLDKAIEFVEYAIKITYPQNPDLQVFNDRLIRLKQQRGDDAI